MTARNALAQPDLCRTVNPSTLDAPFLPCLYSSRKAQVSLMEKLPHPSDTKGSDISWQDYEALTKDIYQALGQSPWSDSRVTGQQMQGPRAVQCVPPESMS